MRQDRAARTDGGGDVPKVVFAEAAEEGLEDFPCLGLGHARGADAVVVDPLVVDPDVKALLGRADPYDNNNNKSN